MKSLFSRVVKSSALLALAFSAGAALAHSDEYFDTIKGPHGGQIRMAGIYHIELVLKADNPSRSLQDVTLYVTDHGEQAKPTAGATATVLIVSGKAKSKVTLTPAADNQLVGQAEYVSSADLQAVVQLTMPGEGHGPIQVQAKFTPFKPMPAAADKAEKASDAHSHHHH